MFQKQNSSVDAILLAVMRVFSILANFCSVAILSRSLNLTEYGTYSEGELIVSVAASVTILGMMDAANYYYNLKDSNQKQYINTISFLQIFIGMACAAVILLGNGLLTLYFKNPALSGIYLYIAFRPLFVNLSNSLLTLQVSIGRAKAVAIRNATVTLLKLVSVLVTAYITKSITTLFVALLILDILTVLYYYQNFKNAAFSVHPLKYSRELIKPILVFSVPMGIYVLSSSLMRDTDKLVIAFFESSESLAIYSNCSAELPLGIIASAFLTVMIPRMTTFVQRNALEDARTLCRAYLGVGYLSTFVLAGACIVLSNEMIRLLYGERYLSGETIFILYLFADAVKFANTTLILTAKKKTKLLMKISLIALAANAVLNVAFYKCIGFAGPAAASVVVSLGMTGTLLLQSASAIHSSVRDLIDGTELRSFAVQFAVVFAVSMVLRNLLRGSGLPYAAIIAIIGALFCGILFALNFKKLSVHIKTINDTKVFQQ